MIACLVYVERGHDIEPSQYEISTQIRAFRRIQNEMKISDPVTREREIRYIQDQLDSLMSGSPYDRDEIGSEITIETAKP